MNYDQPLPHGRRSFYEKPIRPAKIDDDSTDSVSNVNSSQNTALLFKYINDNIIGKSTTVDGPFGRKSGRCYCYSTIDSWNQYLERDTNEYTKFYAYIISVSSINGTYHNPLFQFSCFRWSNLTKIGNYDHWILCDVTTIQAVVYCDYTASGK